jgi:hypothetical protein
MILLAICVGCVTLMSSCGQAPGLRAGAAAVDITPTVWPLALIGSFSYRPATSAHDPLHVRALVLDDGTTRLAIAVVDSCYVPREVLDAAKEQAAAQTGIPTDKMLVSATHTHSAPPAQPGLGPKGPETEERSANEKKYSQQLIEGIASAITKADQQRAPAEIGWAVTQLPDEVFNRRWFMKEGAIPPDPFGGTTDRVRMNPGRAGEDLVRPAGPIDPDISVLSVRTADGRPLALLANYSLHYVGGIPQGQVSADYFGVFANLIRERLAPDGADENFVGILSNGTSGDINNIDFTKQRVAREPFVKARLVANNVAEKTYEAYGTIEHRSSLQLAMAEREITLQMRKPSAEGYEKAKQVLATEDESKLPRRAKPYARRAIRLYEGPDTTDIKLQAVRIGELGITALPFETFVEIGLKLKKESPLRPTFTIELANGANGYLPTPEHHELGGYETWLGTNRVENQASVKITKTRIRLPSRSPRPCWSCSKRSPALEELERRRRSAQDELMHGGSQGWELFRSAGAVVITGLACGKIY